MLHFSLAFLCGILLFQNFSYLPPEKWLDFLIPLAMCLLYWKISRFVAFGLLGFAWMLFYVHLQMNWSLPENVEGKTIKITGTIISIPNTAKHLTHFVFSLKKIVFENNTQIASGRIRLSWMLEKNVNLLHVGDQWELNVRLKKIHSTLNPAGFDYEAKALQEGIRATGYVVNKAKNTLLKRANYYFFIDRFREALKYKIEKNLPQTNTSPWIVALILGERNGISEENWEVLRNTGTNHLMAIAGLHIGCMAGLAHMILQKIWQKCTRCMLIIPASQAGSIAALCMALFYSMLAGFSIPTQRACIMLSVFILVLLLRRKLPTWHAWSIALFIVLLSNPLDVVTESFWLSFGAVAFIIYGVSGRLASSGLLWKWGRIQWVIALGLIPFSIWLFQQCSIIALIANSIAIPWVGFLIVPLCLLGSFAFIFSLKLGSLILILADKCLSVLWIILSWFSHLPFATWHQVLPHYWILIFSTIGIILLLLPVGFPGRYFGFFWLLPLFFYKTSELKIGEIHFTLLDVGQGLSAVVQTKNHILVYDAGAKLNSNYDMGESVVIPFLELLGIKSIDRIVVSHGDNDHIGGVFAILKKFPVDSIKTSVPEKLPFSSTSFCLRGESWDWDGVHFKFLYPDLNHLGLGNNSSCVLKISTADKQILLTGDIEKIAENELIKNEKENLFATILVAPHHGSKTSANMDFIKAVHPAYVLFPVGYRNRYHFPHPIVIERYLLQKAISINTVDAGAIEILLSTAEKYQVLLFRNENKHYWNN